MEFIKFSLLGLFLMETGADLHAPCYHCEFMKMRLLHKSLPKVRSLSKRSHHNPIEESGRCTKYSKCDECAVEECMDGIRKVKDGCGCCQVCARQYGDYCDYKHVCDEEKHLYCDNEERREVRGRCKVKSQYAKKCNFNGVFYKDGEKFDGDFCQYKCNCQNGIVACVNKCLHEERPPFSSRCRNPMLIKVGSRCCKEWVCPLVLDPPSNPEPTPSRVPCPNLTSVWSACTKSCGMGVSFRVRNDNENCFQIKEKRLCMIRTCHLMDEHMKTKQEKCPATWKFRDEIKYLEYNGCRSAVKYKLNYCSNCKKKKCCYPRDFDVIDVEFRCPNQRRFSEQYMKLNSCTCRPKRHAEEVCS